MAKKVTFEIYEGFTKRKKKYVVSNGFLTVWKHYKALVDYSKRLFRCSERHLMICKGYIYDGVLYLENPAKPGAKLVSVAYYVR